MNTDTPQGDTKPEEVEPGSELLTVKVTSRVSGKGSTEKCPKNEVVPTIISYMGISLVKGEGLRIVLADDQGDLVKIETENRTVPRDNSPIFEMDMIEVVKLYARNEAERREAEDAARREAAQKPRLILPR